MWHSNEFRTNTLIEQNWTQSGFHILTREHFYHVGSTEELRHLMIEGLITNFPVHAARGEAVEIEQMAFFEGLQSVFPDARHLNGHVT